jgi:tetratricopeptide (TPR) repeat protein
LRAARLAAGRQAWGDVRGLLAPALDQVRQSPELTVLLAEAEYRGNRPSDAEMLAAIVDALPAGSAPAAIRSRAANVVGAAAFTMGRLAEAEGAFTRALERGRDADDDLVAARACNNLGNVLNLRGDVDGALARYRLAIPLYQRVGQPRGLAECYHNMAIVAREQHRWTDADDLERRAMACARQANDARLLAMALVGRAEVALASGDVAPAAMLASRAADALRDLDDAAMEADARRLIGQAETARGHFATAEAALTLARDLARRAGDALITAECTEAMATLAAAQGDTDAASALGREAVDAYRTIGSPTALRRAVSLVERLGG